MPRAAAKPKKTYQRKPVEVPAGTPPIAAQGDDGGRIRRVIRRISADRDNSQAQFRREATFLARRRLYMGYTSAAEFVKITTVNDEHKLNHLERGLLDPRVSKHFHGTNGLAKLLDLTPEELYWLICTDDPTPPPNPKYDNIPAIVSRPIPYSR
jgi:hypothetical protein